jgi:hypothetical protein
MYAGGADKIAEHNQETADKINGLQVVLTGLLDTLKENMPCADAAATMCIGTHTLYRKIIIKTNSKKNRPYLLDQLQLLASSPGKGQNGVHRKLFHASGYRYELFDGSYSYPLLG